MVMLSLNPLHEMKLMFVLQRGNCIRGKYGSDDDSPICPEFKRVFVDDKHSC